MNKIKLFVPAFSLFLAFTACNQSEKKADDKANTDSVTVSKSVEIVLTDVNSDLAYDQYLKLKDVLVLSDSLQTQAAAKDLAGTLAKITGAENSVKLASEIAAETSLSKQRVAFTTLSNDLISMFKMAEITSGSMFVQFCPMANEGEGGYWLASETEIRNPYYGDEMLNCGEVKETIQKK
jgi:hypothetical protein